MYIENPEDFIVEELPLYEPTGAGTHTLFALRKRNLTTFAAINRIAQHLDVRSRDIGYAGLKDKNAITTQILSVAEIDPHRLMDIQLPDIEILWARRHPHKLRVGHLRGNRFVITLRDTPHAALPHLKARMARLQKCGVPNRFGPQRFGNRNDSHCIGKALLREEWDTAARYLRADDAEGDAQDTRNTGDTQQGETQARPIHTELGRRPTRRIGTALPHRLRKLYLSAYQAHLFNQVLERRLPGLGELRDGDIAIKHENGAPFLVQNAATEQHRADALEISPSGPVFGYKMRRPSGDVLIAEQALLTAEGVRFEDFRKVLGIRLPGTRRPFRMLMHVESVFAVADGGIRLSFTLPAGGYATVVLAEL